MNNKIKAETQVVNVSVKNIRPKYLNLNEWIQDSKFNVYIGRARVVFIDGVRYPTENSIWANPYKITKTRTREEAIELYREYVEKKLKSNPSLINELVKLKGKNLGCWCKPECCHGDVLLELIEKYLNV